jgi:hypothetical protein
MGRERYYNTKTDSTLTMNQKLLIIEGITRGTMSLKSQLIERPDLDEPIDLNKFDYYMEIFKHNSRLLRVWGDLTMGHSQPKFLFRNERLAQIRAKSVLISSKTGVSVDEIYDDFVEIMSCGLHIMY